MVKIKQIPFNEIKKTSNHYLEEDSMIKKYIKNKTFNEKDYLMYTFVNRTLENSLKPEQLLNKDDFFTLTEEKKNALKETYKLSAKQFNTTPEKIKEAYELVEKINPMFYV